MKTGFEGTITSGLGKGAVFLSIGCYKEKNNRQPVNSHKNGACIKEVSIKNLQKEQRGHTEVNSKGYNKSVFLRNLFLKINQTVV